MIKTDLPLRQTLSF